MALTIIYLILLPVSTVAWLFPQHYSKPVDRKSLINIFSFLSLWPFWLVFQLRHVSEKFSWWLSNYKSQEFTIKEIFQLVLLSPIALLGFFLGYGELNKITLTALSGIIVNVLLYLYLLTFIDI